MQTSSSETMERRMDGILAFIEAYRKEHSYSPTNREIGKAMGISSTSLVAYYLNALEDRGLITRTAGVSRSIIPVMYREDDYVSLVTV